MSEVNYGLALTFHSVDPNSGEVLSEFTMDSIQFLKRKFSEAIIYQSIGYNDKNMAPLFFGDIVQDNQGVNWAIKFSDQDGILLCRNVSGGFTQLTAPYWTHMTLMGNVHTPGLKTGATHD